MERRRILLDGVPVWTVVQADQLVTPDGRRVAAAEAVHLPPCQPTKIIGVHVNFRSRLAEFGREVRDDATPTYFLKAPSALNAHRGAVVRPAGCELLNYEGEIGAIVGRSARHVAPEDAPGHIAGYTIANDFALHDFRDADFGSLFRTKSGDTLSPLGPGIVDDWDWRGKSVRTLVNGERVQEGSTDEIIWDFAYMLADIARTITLEPGDVILSGTPANSRPVQSGDVVRVEVEGLGALENTIVAGARALDEAPGVRPSRSEVAVSVSTRGRMPARR